MRFLPLLLLAACAANPTSPPEPPALPRAMVSGETQVVELELSAEGEAVLELSGWVEGAWWGQAGAESVVVWIRVDDAVQRHLVWSTGAAVSSHRVALGALAAGKHRVKLDYSPTLSPAKSATLRLETATLALHPDPELARHAPVLFGREDSARNDSPALLYGRRDGDMLRYTLVFTNEDGGTGNNPRQLVAQWGRLTDIETVLEVNAVTGEVRYQGLGHGLYAFKGRSEGTHPLLWVATSNGIFADDGSPAPFRFAPAVVAFDDSARPREAVMEEHPWLFELMDDEAAREGKLDPACVDPLRVWASRCYALIDLQVSATPALGSRLLGGVDVLGGGVAHRSEAGLESLGRLARTGWVRVAVPVGRAPVEAVRLYAVPDGQGAFTLTARNPRGFQLGSEGAVKPLSLSGPATVTATSLLAPLTP
jgi:hypothetical protein